VADLGVTPQLSQAGQRPNRLTVGGANRRVSAHGELRQQQREQEERDGDDPERSLRQGDQCAGGAERGGQPEGAAGLVDEAAQQRRMVARCPRHGRDRRLNGQRDQRDGDHDESQPIPGPRRLKLQHGLPLPDRQASEQQCSDRDTYQPPDDVGNAAARGSARQRQQTGGHGGCGQGHHGRHSQVCRETFGGVGGHGQSKGGRHRDGGRLAASRHLDPEVLTAGDGQEESHEEPPPRLCRTIRDVRDHDDQARQRQHQPDEPQQLPDVEARWPLHHAPPSTVGDDGTGPAPHGCPPAMASD
jgi:hypothetical protein